MFACANRCLLCCFSVVLTAGLEKLGTGKDLGVVIVQCYKQILTTFAQRKEREDGWFETARKSSLDALIDQVQVISSTLEASRKCKVLLAEACEMFAKKPGDGLRVLQEGGLLPNPVTPETVANFLRYAPQLSKQAVGAFLGELGKQDFKFEWDDPAFHSQLLSKYVESFELNDKSVLDCMRIFLSAFRLPGEAQQIDRILVAFSEYCHKSCVEGKNGLLENPEVTYLLSFSIIMLNTDRHNPNIRSERKMTLEQFVRNNTNYGRDVNQTVPLPRDFLESIYNSISERQIRTESDDPWAIVTDEEWMDLQMQSLASKWAGSLITIAPIQPAHPPSSCSEEYREEASKLFEDLNSCDLQAYVGSKLFSTKYGLSETLELVLASNELQNASWFVDRDILLCCADVLLLPCIAVHLYNHRLIKCALSSIEAAANQDTSEGVHFNGWKERTGRLISLSGEFTSELMLLMTKHSTLNFFEQIIAILAEVCGMHQVS